MLEKLLRGGVPRGTPLGGLGLGVIFWGARDFFCPGTVEVEVVVGSVVLPFLLLAWALSFCCTAWPFRFSGQPWRVHEGLAISSRIGYMFMYLSVRYMTGNQPATKSMGDAGSSF